MGRHDRKITAGLVEIIHLTLEDFPHGEFLHEFEQLPDLDIRQIFT